MKKMLLLLVLVFDTATASRNEKLNAEKNLMALKGGYHLKGNMFRADDHFPLGKNDKDMVPGVKRVVMPFYIGTYYCWIHLYSKCPKPFLASRNIPDGKTGPINPGKQETSLQSGKSKMRRLQILSCYLFVI